MTKTNELSEQKGLNAPHVMPRFFIRSFTNAGDFSKQYFKVLSADGMEDGLIIKKLVLTDNLSLYGRDFRVIKVFKDKYLMEQNFAIKIKTLNRVMTSLNGA